MSISRHLLGYAPVKLAGALAAFGGIYFYTRLLGADEYGRYALMFSVLALVHTFSITWIEASAYRFTSKAEIENNFPDHFRTALGLLGRSLLVGALCLLLLLWLFRDMPQYKAFLPYIALLLPLNALIKISLEARRARQQVKRYMIPATLKPLIGFAVGVLLAWKTGLGAVAPFAGLLSASVTIVLFEGPWLFQHAHKGVSKANDRQAWILYGIPTAFALILDMLLSSADRFLIAYFMDESAVGGYAAGYGVADKTVLLLCAWVAMASSPHLMRAYDTKGLEGVKTPANDFARLLLLIGCPAAFGLAFVADPLSAAMIGESVREQARRIIPWIAFSGLLNGFLIHYFSESFQLARKTRERAMLMLIPVALNLVLNVLAIPKYGIFGAVLATIITYAVAVLLLAFYGRRHVALPIPLIDIIKITAASLAMWPVIQIIPEMNAWAELFVKTAIGALAYFAALFLFYGKKLKSMIKI